MEQKQRCQFWLSKKKRFCAGSPLPDSLYCGNHNPYFLDKRIPCPLDPSHTVLESDVAQHIKRCPYMKQIKAQMSKPYYKQGINSGNDDECMSSSMRLPSVVQMHTYGTEDKRVPLVAVKDTYLLNMAVNGTQSPCLDSSENESRVKREIVHTMSDHEFSSLLEKIQSAHTLFCQNEIWDSYVLPAACDTWLNAELDRGIPFQEKHIMQQASILGNLEVMGIIKSLKCPSVRKKHIHDGKLVSKQEQDLSISSIKVVEFGAGRGYLTHMLSDCYGISDIILVDRRSYKFKADRSLRQMEDVQLERLRIDIEDLDIQAVGSLQGSAYVSIGKHLCGPATDFALRCIINGQDVRKKGDDQTSSLGNQPKLQGIGFATCCHHLCQWRSYVNKEFFINLGFSKKEFSAITWFTSWAVDNDLDGANLNPKAEHESNCGQFENFATGNDMGHVTRCLNSTERSRLGLKCKELLDTGRLLWLQKAGLNARLVCYVPSTISPENKLLIARYL